MHLVLSVFPTRGQASGRGLLFNCVGKMPGLAMYFFVQLQLIELAATQWNPIEQKYFWSLFKMFKTI